MSNPADTNAAPSRSASAAVALSFLWPGLGHWYLHRTRTALTYAIPITLVALAVVIRAAAGIESFAISLFDPGLALTAIVLTVVALVWRLLAMADSASAAGPAARAPQPRIVLVSLAVVAILIHSVIVYYAWSFYDAGSRIFVGRVDPDGAVVAPSGTVQPSDLYVANTPFESAPPTSARVTILFTGIDKNSERDHSLTDTLLVVSIDTVHKTVAMVSFPRDLTDFPLYDGRTYHGKINSLMESAAASPSRFPEGPLPTLVHELSFLIGTPIEYFAAIDLDGFPRMVDAVGGVTVDVQRPITDSFYDWLDGSPRGFYLTKGVHVLDGRTALAFVRSRYGIGDNDFTRAARQQQLLVALRAKLSDPAVIAKLPQLLKVASETIRTNFPPDRLTEMIDLAKSIDPANITKVVLEPPTYSYHPPTNTTGGTYTLRMNLKAVERLSVQLFGIDSRFYEGQGAPAPSVSPGP